MRGKVLRAVAGISVLFVIGLVVLGWLGDYRRADKTPPRSENGVSGSTTGTSSPSGAKGEGGSSSSDETATQTERVVVVLIEGLNFRSAPQQDAKPIRGLSKGEKLDLLAEQGGWYKVRDDDGKTGWVTNNPSYTKTERR